MSRYFYIVILIFAGEMVFRTAIQYSEYGFPSDHARSTSALPTRNWVTCSQVMASRHAELFPGRCDRPTTFRQRTLLATSLIATALGGVYMATIPGPWEMAILYGFWGLTTIFLFWGALIRATREWGGKSEQGMAFGILEGGRGVAAALVAPLMVMVLAFYMPDDARMATDEQRRIGFQMVVLGYSAVTFFVWRSCMAIHTRAARRAGGPS